MRARSTSRLASVLACAALLAVGLGACGQKSNPTTAENSNGTNAADASNNGGYVQAGPITYQLQISRLLNPYSVEDSGYLAGVRSAPLPSNEEWYGVFLWARNQTHHPAATTDSFDIVDTEGGVYYPWPINSQVNPYAWIPHVLQPLEVQPIPGSTAYYGPTGGQLLLFKINDSAFANRPLTLQIRAPGETGVSTISLDL